MIDVLCWFRKTSHAIECPIKNGRSLCWFWFICRQINIKKCLGALLSGTQCSRTKFGKSSIVDYLTCKWNILIRISGEKKTQTNKQNKLFNVLKIRQQHCDPLFTAKIHLTHLTIKASLRGQKWNGMKWNVQIVNKLNEMFHVFVFDIFLFANTFASPIVYIQCTMRAGWQSERETKIRWWKQNRTAPTRRIKFTKKETTKMHKKVYAFWWCMLLLRIRLEICATSEQRRKCITVPAQKSRQFSMSKQWTAGNMGWAAISASISV